LLSILVGQCVRLFLGSICVPEVVTARYLDYSLNVVLNLPHGAVYPSRSTTTGASVKGVVTEVSRPRRGLRSGEVFCTPRMVSKERAMAPA